MKQLFLCHLHSYVFSLFSDSSAFFVFVHLNWRANQFETKIAGVSFDRWRFKVFYGVSIVLKVFLGQTVSRRTNCMGMKVRSKLTPHHVTRHLFSHTFVLISFFYLLPFFSIVDLTEKVIEVFIFLSFHLVRC